jgi:hypothetical protein
VRSLPRKENPAWHSRLRWYRPAMAAVELRRTDLGWIRRPVRPSHRGWTIAGHVTVVRGTLSKGDFVRVVRDHRSIATGRLRGMHAGNRRVRQISAESDGTIQIYPMFAFEPGDLIEGFSLADA